MKHFLLLLVPFITILNASAQESNGFWSIPLGKSKDSVKFLIKKKTGLIPFKETREELHYKPATLNGYKPDEVELEFAGDTLVKNSVFYSVSSADFVATYKNLKKVAGKFFGPPALTVNATHDTDDLVSKINNKEKVVDAFLFGKNPDFKSLVFLKGGADDHGYFITILLESMGYYNALKKE